MSFVIHSTPHLARAVDDPMEDEASCLRAIRVSIHDSQGYFRPEHGGHPLRKALQNKFSKGSVAFPRGEEFLNASDVGPGSAVTRRVAFKRSVLACLAASRTVSDSAPSCIYRPPPLPPSHSVVMSPGHVDDERDVEAAAEAANALSYLVPDVPCSSGPLSRSLPKVVQPLPTEVSPPPETRSRTHYTLANASGLTAELLHNGVDAVALPTSSSPRLTDVVLVQWIGDLVGAVWVVEVADGSTVVARTVAAGSLPDGSATHSVRLSAVLSGGPVSVSVTAVGPSGIGRSVSTVARNALPPSRGLLGSIAANAADSLMHLAADNNSNNRDPWKVIAREALGEWVSDIATGAQQGGNLAWEGSSLPPPPSYPRATLPNENNEDGAASSTENTAVSADVKPLRFSATTTRAGVAIHWTAPASFRISAANAIHLSGNNSKASMTACITSGAVVLSSPPGAPLDTVIYATVVRRNGSTLFETCVPVIRT